MDGTTLLPCPFCGGEASVRVLEYDDCMVWGVFCESDLESEYSHGHYVDNYPTEAEAIAAWNTRAERGTLTAEQVRKLVQPIYFDGYSDGSEHRGHGVEEIDWQAIADELNAELRSGTCDNFSLPEPDGWYKCPECGCVVGYTELYGAGWSIMMDDYQIPFNNCPMCGKAVKR